jgi:hypothetical protein
VEDFWTDPQDRMPEPQPDPKLKLEREKAELDKQAKEHDMMLKQRSSDQEFAHKERMAQLDLFTEQQRIGMEREKMGLSLQTDQQKAEMDMNVKAQSAEFDLGVKSREEEAKSLPRLEQVTDKLMQAITQLAEAQQQMLAGLEKVAKIAAAPRKVIRDPKTGRVLRGEVDLKTLQ